MTGDADQCLGAMQAVSDASAMDVGGVHVNCVDMNEAGIFDEC